MMQEQELEEEEWQQHEQDEMHAIEEDQFANFSEDQLAEEFNNSVGLNHDLHMEAPRAWQDQQAEYYRGGVLRRGQEAPLPGGLLL